MTRNNDAAEGPMQHACLPVDYRELMTRLVAENPEKARQARENQRLRAWFVGQAMVETKGKANPHAAQSVLDSILENIPCAD